MGHDADARVEGHPVQNPLGAVADDSGLGKLETHFQFCVAPINKILGTAEVCLGEGFSSWLGKILLTRYIKVVTCRIDMAIWTVALL